jgi:type IV secretion system protein VirB6
MRFAISWFQASPADFLRVDSLGSFLYYARIYKFMQDRIGEIGPAIMTRMMGFVGLVALVLMTVWILWHGFRIVTGQSRASMMDFIMQSARNTLIVATATTMTFVGSNLHHLLTDTLDRFAVEVIVGEEGRTSQELIEQNLALMQLALSSIDAVQIAEDGKMSLGEQKTRALWMVGFGAGGPAVTASVMLLMYQVAMALFIGLGPLFVLCLMFEQTKSMFWRWLYYGIGTTFSMGVLALMTKLALEVVGAVTASFWITAGIGALTGANLTEGMSSMALQQGGIGLLLTMLLISVPPIAANFFQGAVSNFMPYSAFGAGGGSGGGRAGHRPGESGFQGYPALPGHAPPSRGTGPRVDPLHAQGTQFNVPSNRIATGAAPVAPPLDGPRTVSQQGQAQALREPSGLPLPPPPPPPSSGSTSP